MPVRFIVFALLILPACDSSTATVSEELSRQFNASGRTFVNLAEVLPRSWNRVCIMGPYSDNKAVKETLGFQWDVIANSSITKNDSISLLLFVQNNQVVEQVEHPRRDGDFANLSRQCFSKENATFYYQINPKKGWPGLFPNK